MKRNTYIVALALMLIGAFSRLIDRLPNFSMMEGLALFGGAYLLSRAAAYLVPLATMYISDLAINNTISRTFFPDIEGVVWFDTYMIYNAVAMIAIVAFARVALKKITGPRVIGGAVVASTLFFIITNTGAWAGMPIYTKDLAGLVTAMTAGIPFYSNSLLSTVVFSSVLFGSFELYKRYAQQGEFATETVSK